MERRDIAHRQQAAFDFERPPSAAAQATANRELDRPWEGRVSRIKDVLEALKRGPLTTNDLLQVSTHRFACDIYDLRQRGYDIRERSIDKSQSLYTLVGFKPTRKLRKGMQEAYYASQHWRSLAARRREIDGHQCTRCKTRSAALHVHHWLYDLFNEHTDDLQTYCEDCHAWIHGLANVRVAFPTRASEEVYERLAALKGATQ